MNGCDDVLVVPYDCGCTCADHRHCDSGAPLRGECRAGGPHVFQAMDPRDADTWGRTGLRCVECGAAPKEER